MNKNDIKLILILLLLISLSLIIINKTKKEGTTAIVYYENKEILKIDMNLDKEYTVQGLLGDVIIEVKENKIRVKKENSPNHICSKEGYISDSTKPLICLPNKVVIKIVQSSDMDGVVY